jgi:hypothetical protein
MASQRTGGTPVTQEIVINFGTDSRRANTAPAYENAKTLVA